MTDEQITKALECCKYEYGTKCELCCYNIYSKTGCRSELRRNALDLINRQKAEIERLKKLLAEEEEKYKLCAKRFYTEAIKELLDKIEKQAIPNEDDVYWVELDDIYNSVKEMVGDAE